MGASTHGRLKGAMSTCTHMGCTPQTHQRCPRGTLMAQRAVHAHAPTHDIKDVDVTVMAACCKLGAIWRVLQLLDALGREVHLSHPLGHVLHLKSSGWRSTRQDRSEISCQHTKILTHIKLHFGDQQILSRAGYEERQAAWKSKKAHRQEIREEAGSSRATCASSPLIPRQLP